MKPLELLNLIAVFVAPIAAVIIGQLLQDFSEKRKDKMRIFQCLMTHRATGWGDSFEAVNALNSIDIVFSTDKKVRSCWAFFRSKCYKNFSDQERLTAQWKLLEAIAVSLGYKNKITWETIQNPYIPKGMMEAMDQQQIIQKGQTELAKVAGAFAQMINTNAANQAPNRQEDNSHANT